MRNSKSQRNSTPPLHKHDSRQTVHSESTTRSQPVTRSQPAHLRGWELKTEGPIRIRIKTVKKKLYEILFSEKRRDSTTSDGDDTLETMIILVPGELPPEETAERRRGFIDTGASINIVTDRILEELDIKYYKCRSTAKTVGKDPVELLGFVIIVWRRELDPEKEFNTKFHVISKEVSGEFDFLLGKHWNKESGALKKAVHFMTLRS